MDPCGQGPRLSFPFFLGFSLSFLSFSRFLDALLQSSYGPPRPPQQYVHLLVAVSAYWTLVDTVGIYHLFISLSLRVFLLISSSLHLSVSSFLIHLAPQIPCSMLRGRAFWVAILSLLPSLLNSAKTPLSCICELVALCDL